MEENLLDETDYFQDAFKNGVMVKVEKKFLVVGLLPHLEFVL